MITPAKTQAERKNICLLCPDHRPIAGGLGTCGIPILGGNGTCGCFLKAKIKLANQKCPKGKWDAC